VKQHTQSVPSVHRTLVGAICLSLQPLALAALSVPVIAIIIRRLGPEGYAQWMVSTSLLAVCAVLTSLGLRGAFVRRVAADPAASEGALADQLGLRLLLAGLAGIVVIAVCSLLGYPSPVLWCTVVGSAGVLLTTFATTMADMLQSHHRLKTLAGVNTVAGLALTGVSLLTAWSGAGPVAIAAAYLTGPVVSGAMLYTIVRRQICPVAVHWDVRRFWGLLVGSRFFAAQQLLAAGSAQAEALLLPRLIGLGQFGYFSAGAMLVNRLTALPDGLCTAAYPGMARAFAKGGVQGRSLVTKYLVIAAVGGAVVAFAGVLLADLIGRILFPNGSELFGTVAKVTIWALPLMAIDSVMGNALNAAGKDAAQARASVPAAVASLVGAATLVYGLGITGACWSMLLRPCVRIAFLAPVLVATFRLGKGAETAEVGVAPDQVARRKAG
jgi:O-antigen/teichoic acid export membrane protein